MKKFLLRVFYPFVLLFWMLFIFFPVAVIAGLLAVLAWMFTGESFEQEWEDATDSTLWFLDVYEGWMISNGS